MIKRQKFNNGFVWLFAIVLTTLVQLAAYAQNGTEYPEGVIVRNEPKEQAGLIARWKMDGDCRDSAGPHHGVNHGVTFTEGHDGRADGAALFDPTRQTWIEITDDNSLHFGTGEFSIAMWVKLDDEVENVFGDIMSKYDPTARRGFNLPVMSSSPLGSSVSDIRNVHFGIDNGIVSEWTDCGQPWPSNTLISTLVVLRGDLYAGIADARDPEMACRVFRYAGGTEWIDCGRLGDNPLSLTVRPMIAHKGHLYAGVGVWDHIKAIAGISSRTRVYRYEGGTTWRDCGRFGEGFRVQSMASFKGHLYVGDDTGKCYRYDGGTEWTFCGQLGSDNRVNTLMVYRGNLYGASHFAVYRYDGSTEWTPVSSREMFGSNQLYGLQTYGGHLYAGSWPDGKVMRYEKPMDWTLCGQLGISPDYKINEVMDLVVYNGKLYAGTIPLAEAYRYEQDMNWTLMKSLVKHPNWNPSKPDLETACRLSCFSVFQGRLYAGTGAVRGLAGADPDNNFGRVYSMEAGKNVSLDDDIGSGWRHIAVVREKSFLKLYVDGWLRATSTRFNASDYDISNSMPLLIGYGRQEYLSGALDDVRIYRGALDSNQVRHLYHRTKGGEKADFETESAESKTAGEDFGATPLHRAAMSGQKAEVARLLAQGLDVNLRDDFDTTPLHSAAVRGHRAIVELLLDKGADIGAKNKAGATALHWAAYRGYEDIVKLLLDRGAGVDDTERQGLTALHWVAMSRKDRYTTTGGREAVVKLLLDRGADINNKNDDYRFTPLHFAEWSGNRDIAGLLKARGGTE